jgi:pimeloyl-ACP methyl ester carboxylesterase
MNYTELDSQTMQTSLGAIDTLELGDGPALLVLHHDSGREDGAEILRLLAERFHVIAPSLPGYDASPRADWMRSPAHLAYVALDLIAAISPQGCVVLGLGYGGWIAAELAVMSPRAAEALVLHAPMGIRPRSGAFLDQFLIASDDYVHAGFSSAAAFERAFGASVDEDVIDRWERNRETTSRLAWRPYMYDQALPHLLARCRQPTLVTWGSKDRIVPRACAESYATLIPAAELVALPGCGHYAELEAPEVFAETVVAFLERRWARRRSVVRR